MMDLEPSYNFEKLKILHFTCAKFVLFVYIKTGRV